MIHLSDIYPYLALASILITIGGFFVKTLAKENLAAERDGWKETALAQEKTINALQPRIEALESEVEALKSGAAKDHITIASLKGERTRLRARVTVLSRKVAILTKALNDAGIDIPSLPSEADEEPEPVKA